MSENQYPFRVFISYAHADRDVVVKMVAILENLGLQPIWDKDINPGRAFTDEIKDLITRAHLFIPVITGHSKRRPWVHQETGFAIALNIPVLPIAIGVSPGEMIAPIQAIVVQPDLGDLAERLRQIDLMALVAPNPRRPYGIIEIADWPEARAEQIARYSQWVLDVTGPSLLRLQARFSIFSIPDYDPDHPIWEQRDSDQRREEHLRSLQRQERKVMEHLARTAGCRLLIDPTAKTFSAQGPLARKTRLSILLAFIQSMPEDKLEVVISQRAQDTNLVMVGDYFFAESAAPRPGGYAQTILNSHPPTVLQRLRRFDQLFNELKTSGGSSPGAAAQSIENILKDL